MLLPILHKYDTKGNKRIWSVDEIQEGDTSFTTRTGIEGGKMTVKVKTCTQTRDHKTMYDAVVAKARSEWTKKYNSGMKCDDGDQGEVLFPISPTLASEYNPDEHWRSGSEYYVQYKYDGVLCIGTLQNDGTVLLHSRGREEWPFCEHVRRDIAVLMRLLPKGSYHLVGELYIHDTPLENIISIVRGKDSVIHEMNPKLQYIVYDLVDAYPSDGKTYIPYKYRLQLLQRMFDISRSSISSTVLAPIIGIAKCSSDADELLRKAESEKYEGIILRHPDMMYFRRIKYRNPLLLKYKSFHDCETTIVGARCGKNSHDKCILFIVELDGIQFTVTPRGSLQERKDMWDDYCSHPDKYVGKRYTIRYPCKNSYGIPKFSIGICIRPDADQ